MLLGMEWFDACSIAEEQYFNQWPEQNWIWYNCANMKPCDLNLTDESYTTISSKHTTVAVSYQSSSISVNESLRARKVDIPPHVLVTTWPFMWVDGEESEQEQMDKYLDLLEAYTAWDMWRGTQPDAKLTYENKRKIQECCDACSTNDLSKSNPKTNPYIWNTSALF